MSSEEEESAIPAFKKRKLQRACDYCRRKKVKCDGSQMPNNRCSRCTARRTECTYVEGDNVRNYHRSVIDDTSYRYVEELESRLERMETLMSKICPDADVAHRLDVRESDKDAAPAPGLLPAFEGSHGSASRVSALIPPSTLAVTPPTLSPASPDHHHQSEEEDGDIDRDIAEGIGKLSLGAHPFRYHGRSSGMVFIRSAIALKNECTGSTPKPPGDGQHPWVTALVEDALPVFEESSFPPRDLLDTLVDLYFRHENCHYPLLHEPTFKKSVAAGQHLRNGGFGATVLLVCAIGSRFSRDPRVLLQGSTHHHSAGWKWFTLVERARRLSFGPAKLQDLQVYALMAMFLDATTVPQATWSVIGTGVRAALEVGAHRKKMYAPTPNVEEELWRRAFWTLVLLEWISSHAFGRPCSIHDEDFDVSLPTECDDEYWLTLDGEPLFKQPPGKPSKVSSFVCMLRLCQGLALANRTIFTTNKSRAQQGDSDEQWVQRMVIELDSVLNKWADSLPHHLRWNPEEENEMFLTQAATLATWHQGHQIAVHRSFMSSPGSRESPISLPSTIICANAARASIQVAEVLHKRRGSLTHRNTGIVFMAATVLMTNMLGLKRSGRTVHMEKDITLVRRTAEILRSSRYETHYADSLADILCDLISGVTRAGSISRGTRAQENIPSAPVNEADAAQPSSPVAISFERRPHGRRTDSDGPRISGQHTAADLNNAGAGLSRAHPGVTQGRPLGLDSSLSDTSSFTMSFPLTGQEPPASDLSAIVQSTSRGPQEHLAPSAFPHAGVYDFFPILEHDPLQPLSSSSTSANTNQGTGTGPGDTGEWMFGLKPPGHQPSMPGPSFLPPASQTEGSAIDNFQANGGFGDAAIMQLAVQGGDQGDNSVPDFTLMDDTLTMWSSMPPTFGWNEWGTSFASANGNSGM